MAVLAPAERAPRPGHQRVVERRGRGRAPGRRGARGRRPAGHAGGRAHPAAAGGHHRRGGLAPRDRPGGGQPAGRTARGRDVHGAGPPGRGGRDRPAADTGHRREPPGTGGARGAARARVRFPAVPRAVGRGPARRPRGRGRAARGACAATGTGLLSYPIWTWHWSHPGDPRVPWEAAARVPLSAEAARRKRAAIGCFASQLRPRGPQRPPALLAEILSRTSSATRKSADRVTSRGDAGRCAIPTASTWCLTSYPGGQSRWYARLKYVISVVMLLLARSRIVFEPGRSIGREAQPPRSAPRCDVLLPLEATCPAVAVMWAARRAAPFPRRSSRRATSGSGRLGRLGLAASTWKSTSNCSTTWVTTISLPQS